MRLKIAWKSNDVNCFNLCPICQVEPNFFQFCTWKKQKNSQNFHSMFFCFQSYSKFCIQSLDKNEQRDKRDHKNVTCNEETETDDKKPQNLHRQDRRILDTAPVAGTCSDRCSCLCLSVNLSSFGTSTHGSTCYSFAFRCADSMCVSKNTVECRKFRGKHN